MQIIFTRRRTLASALIRLATGSRWSHVSVGVSPELVIDATLTHRGVRYRPRQQLLAEASAHEVRDVPVPDEAAALAWLQAQVGKRYDWTAIVGFVFRGRWADPDAWFCSELAEAAIEAGGLVRFRPEAWRITPGHQWMVR